MMASWDDDLLAAEWCSSRVVAYNTAIGLLDGMEIIIVIIIPTNVYINLRIPKYCTLLLLNHFDLIIIAFVYL